MDKRSLLMFRFQLARVVGWSVASFVIGCPIYIIGFVAISIGAKPPRQADWPEAVVGLIPCALMFWLFLGIVIVPLLLVATFSLATLCRRIKRFDGSYTAAFFSSMILGSIVLVSKLMLLEHPISPAAVADKYYGLEWLTLVWGIFLSRVVFKSLHPGRFYED